MLQPTICEPSDQILLGRWGNDGLSDWGLANDNWAGNFRALGLSDY